MRIEVCERVATFDEYCALCVAVGWENGMDFAVASQSLARSLYGVVVQQNGRTIGMGRVVGDGTIYFYVQGVAVHPDFQGQGIGKKIMQYLMAYIERQAHGPAFIGLFATDPARALYEQYGFTVGNLTGMFKIM